MGYEPFGGRCAFGEGAGKKLSNITGTSAMGEPQKRLLAVSRGNG